MKKQQKSNDPILNAIKDEKIKSSYKAFTRDFDKSKLKDMAKYLNYNYSFGNSWLISIQTKMVDWVVKGFKQWNKEGIRINKGEKAVKILAPRPYKYKKIEKDEDEEKETVHEGIYFVPVSIFEIGQTNAEKEYIDKLENSKKTFDRSILDYSIAKQIAETFTKVKEDIDNRNHSNGSWSPDTKRITIHRKVGSTVIHEIGHHRTYIKDESYSKNELRAEVYNFLFHKKLKLKFNFNYSNCWNKEVNLDYKTFHKWISEIQKYVKADYEKVKHLLKNSKKKKQLKIAA